MHILLIARHYPPEISGGARRPFLYTRGLRELGHKVTIVTPFILEDKDSICVPNAAAQAHLEHASLRPKPTSDAPTMMSRAKGVLRDWVYWPDNNINWVRDVIRSLKARDLKPDWIFTTSPPESVHLAGAKLARHFQVPWLAELRDTWVETPHRSILERSGFRRRVERYIARRNLQHATAVTAVSEAVLKEARNYVRDGLPETIIPHFSEHASQAYSFDPARLNLVHTGGFTLSDRRRLLPTLLTALEEVSRQRPNLTFHIAGPLTSAEYDLIKATSIDVQIHGSVSLEKSRALQAGADGLLLYTPANSHALPGKYAEYRAAGKPILYLGGGDWMNLVESQFALRPLVEGGAALTKGETCPSTEEFFYQEATLQLLELMV